MFPKEIILSHERMGTRSALIKKLKVIFRNGPGYFQLLIAHLLCYYLMLSFFFNYFNYFLLEIKIVEFNYRYTNQ